ncbi:hypothetical protein [Caulobacter rhizosphaerae]|jgi:hypothetical protein|uniref:hypothetical protein n=1 Tax=Caulobacter rhizosphaerae TaxID=2010972 RepID=UPI0013D83C05|nr:hypothetical protein [Caulobacter rhizosphaerae]GGL39459.1 hypothetical protein GCM10010983_40670 [Caulobacter rhizosphaerae]
MQPKRLPHGVTIVFFMATAASFVAQWYVGIAHGFPVGPALSLAMFLSVLGALIPSLIRTIRLRAWEWAPAAIALAALLAMDLIWRLFLSPFPDVYKRVALVIFGAEPVIVALGIVAVIAEWRRHRQIGPRREHRFSPQR